MTFGLKCHSNSTKLFILEIQVFGVLRWIEEFGGSDPEFPQKIQKPLKYRNLVGIQAYKT